MTKIAYKKLTQITEDGYREDTLSLGVALDLTDVLRILKLQGYIFITDDKGTEHIILTHMIVLIE
jgi:hypothetical protein